MKIFPTQYSLLSTIALEEHLIEAYGLSSMTLRLLIHNVSDTYVLTHSDKPEEKYIFKMYRDSHRNYEEICGEVELLNILKEKGAKVSYPLTDLKGNQVQQFNAAEGIRNGVLFSYAQGHPVYDLDAEKLQLIGREMALIHNVTSRITLQHQRHSYDVNTTLLDPLKGLKVALKDDPKAFAFLEETALKVIRKMEQFDTQKFSYGYCHYDYMPKNFHFNEAGAITFFDFDFAGKGYLANDLMSFYIHFFFHSQYQQITQAQAELDFKVFIEAYRTVRPLAEEEIEAIPYLGFMYWVFYFDFYYQNFEDLYNTMLTPRFIRERIATIKKWTELLFV